MNDVKAGMDRGNHSGAAVLLTELEKKFKKAMKEEQKTVLEEFVEIISFQLE